MSLGGDGGLNLPFEPTEPLDRPPPDGGWFVATGVVVKSAVFEHPRTRAAHPGLVLQFSQPDGSLSQEVLVVVEISELEGLAELVTKSVAHAVASVKGGN